MNDEELKMLNWKINQQEFVNTQHEESTGKDSEWWISGKWYGEGYLHALQWIRDSMQKCIEDTRTSCSTTDRSCSS